MSDWNHATCLPCWMKQHPEGRMPLTVSYPFRSTEACCYCGTVTQDGIYVWEDPERVPCQGEHHAQSEDPAPEKHGQKGGGEGSIDSR